MDVSTTGKVYWNVLNKERRGEYLGSTKGMGWLLSAAGDVFNSTRVLCCVLVLVVLIIALDAVVHLLEWRLLRWRG